jgi:glyoxylase-like metal-dependent hydrolase (beta-lactamase superfamily II)
VKAVSLHRDVIVATSAIWQTNCAVIRSAEESFLVDSPILPAELDSLKALIEQAGFPAPSGLLATHADWDHLLGRLAFPGVTLGCAESTAARMKASPGEAQRELRTFDEEHLIERDRPLALGAIQALPVPGSCEIGESELELHPAGGHTGDGMVVLVSWAGVLLVGDYLSTVELPVLGAGSTVAAYLAMLERLCPIIERAEHIVPGHGPVLNGAQALTALEEDVAYLEALRELGGEAELPQGRHTKAQRGIHAKNVTRRS